MTSVHLNDYSNDELFDKISPLLNDGYQFTMAYTYWRRNKHMKNAVFHMYYRTGPFKGEYVVFSGLDRALKMIQNFKFTDDDILRLKYHYGDKMKNDFYDYLKTLDFSAVTIRAVTQGTICPPNIPLLVVEGPVIMCQLLETPLLNMTSFPTLVSTYAHRIVRTVSNNKKEITFVDFGLRRAQGPDGAMTASKYCQIGGFDGTSNVLSGSINGDNIVGTMAHACVMMTETLDEVVDTTDEVNNVLRITLNEFKTNVLANRSKLGGDYLNTNDGELGAFIEYAFDFPNGFVALLDTYNTLESGLLNYVCVGLTLAELGANPVGVRLDSGDLSYLSKEIRKHFKNVDELLNVNFFSSNKIVASNEIGDDVMLELERNGHEIDIFGIGTNIATCKKTPSLGMVYKVVKFDNNYKIKFSEDPDKSTIPCDKQVHRLYGSDNVVILDLMTEYGHDIQYEKDGTIFCRHPTKQSFCVHVKPTHVEPLLQTVLSNGKVLIDNLSIKQAKHVCDVTTRTIREDHMRHLNPTPMKVSLDKNLYNISQTTALEKRQHKILS